MKKILSFLMSAVVGASVLSAFPAVAEDTAKNENGGVVLFGDSIAAGYGLNKKTEYNYGQIIGDYLDCEVNNYAVSGDTTVDMLNVIDTLSAEQRQKLADSDYVVISVGANDLMRYASRKILKFAADRNLLNEGFTKDNIPEEAGISELMLMLNIDGEGGIVDYASSGLTAVMELNSLIKDLAGNLRFSNSKYEGYIVNSIIPNIESAVSKIKAINPDARIIVQTVYQPLQMAPEYIDEKFGLDSSYADMITLLRSNFKDILDTFRDELKKVPDIEVADVYYQITSVPDTEKQNTNNPGYAYMFTNIQGEGLARDIHPNQKGHLAIASTILETIGDLHDDNGLLTSLYLKLPVASNGMKYPLLATDTYKRVAGNIMNGDISFDGVVDGSDATLALKEYAYLGGGFKTTLSEIQSDCGDANGDGAVDGTDATILLRYYSYSSSGGEDSFDKFIENNKLS